MNRLRRMYWRRPPERLEADEAPWTAWKPLNVTVYESFYTEAQGEKGIASKFGILLLLQEDPGLRIGDLICFEAGVSVPMEVREIRRYPGHVEAVIRHRTTWS